MIIKLNRRKVYRGDVYDAILKEQIKRMPFVLEDRYANGVVDGLAIALEVLANDVKDIKGDT